MHAVYLESFRFKAFLARAFVVGLVWFVFKMQTPEAFSPMLCLKSSVKSALPCTDHGSDLAQYGLWPANALREPLLVWEAELETGLLKALCLPLWDRQVYGQKSYQVGGMV